MNEAIRVLTLIVAQHRLALRRACRCSPPPSSPVQHHAHRTLAHLRCKLVRCLAHNRPFLSGVGASGSLGALHFIFDGVYDHAFDKRF